MLLCGPPQRAESAWSKMGAAAFLLEPITKEDTKDAVQFPLLKPRVWNTVYVSGYI